MIFGRDEERKILKERYESNNFELVSIFGRRRIGKTALIIDLLENIKSNKVYFMATKGPLKENLDILSKAIYKEIYGNEELPSFPSFESLFSFLDKLILSNRFTLVLDEYQYLALIEGVDTGLSSLIQKYADKWKRENKNILLILCGSSVSKMEDLSESYKSPLYGRITQKLEIKELSYKDLKYFLPSYTNEDLVVIYSIFGGIPGYLELLDVKLSIKENVINLILNKNSRLGDEVNYLLKEELRNISLYNSILSSISSGATKLNEIATKVGIEITALPYYLNVLENNVHLISKSVPCGSTQSRNTLYSINDSFFRFYYSFIYRNQSSLVLMNPDDFYDYYLSKERVLSYVGLTFEKIAKEYFVNRFKDKEKREFLALEISKWWGQNKSRKEQTDIDLVIKGEKKIIPVEVKYRNTPLTIKEVNTLLDDTKDAFNLEIYGIFLVLKVKLEKEVEDFVSNYKRSKIFYLDDLFS